MQELGKGAFGTVYKGRLRGTEGPWRAIKKIQKTQIKDVNMLMNEIEISAGLDNPNIVKIYEIYEYNQCVYIVSEYSYRHSVSAKAENSSTGSTKPAVSPKMTPA